MRNFVWLILLVALVSARAETLDDIEEKCSFALTAPSLSVKTLQSGFVKLSSGTELFVRIEKPRLLRVRGWYFLIHGLMDSHRTFDRLSRHLLRAGYGVIRMDLRGSGRTLHREIQRVQDGGERFEAASHHDYLDHVQDLKELLVFLSVTRKIRKPTVVGHSMGGGLALALASDATITPLIQPRVMVVAPYIYRLDFYLAEKITHLGLPLPNPWMRMQTYVPPMLRIGPEYILDTLLSDVQMRWMFGEFFDSAILNRELHVPAHLISSVRRSHVESAMANVKGLREFNALAALQKTAPEIQIDLIYGRRDSIVEYGQARKLARQIEGRGGQTFLMDAGHQILQDHPVEVAKILLSK